MHNSISAAALLGALLFSSQLFADPARGSLGYKLAPGDRIYVTVFGQAELSGDLLVDGDGIIVLPFLEPIEVKNLTVLECQKLIRDRLADGLLPQPSVSVRVSEPRPVYILGDVRSPGEYPFRYGSTVQTAVSLAGGFGANTPLQGAAVSEFLLADERVRQLSFQKQTLLIHRARLEAQQRNETTFSAAAVPGLTAETDIANLIANEKDTLEMQAAMLNGQLKLLRSQKPRIQEEIEALNAQVATTKKQLELVTQHADQYSRLVKQGLGLSTSEMQFRLAEASQENELWRLKAQISRLQMDSGELDIKIQEAEAIFKRQIAVELWTVRDRLNELDVTLPAARKIRDVKLQYAGDIIKVGIKQSVSITRMVDAKSTVLEATSTTPLEPGDTIEIKRLLPDSAGLENTSAHQVDLHTYPMAKASSISSADSAAR